MQTIRSGNGSVGQGAKGAHCSRAGGYPRPPPSQAPGLCRFGPSSSSSVSVYGCSSFCDVAILCKSLLLLCCVMATLGKLLMSTSLLQTPLCVAEPLSSPSHPAKATPLSFHLPPPKGYTPVFSVSVHMMLQFIFISYFGLRGASCVYA